MKQKIAKMMEIEYEETPGVEISVTFGGSFGKQRQTTRFNSDIYGKTQHTLIFLDYDPTFQSVGGRYGDDAYQKNLNKIILNMENKMKELDLKKFRLMQFEKTLNDRKKEVLKMEENNLGMLIYDK